MKDGWVRASIVALLLAGALAVAGCRTAEVVVLPESEQYWLIPAGTQFKTVLKKDGPLVDVVRARDCWAVDAGYLLKLQVEAGRKALELPE